MNRINWIYGVLLCLVFMPALATETLTCISNNNDFQRCDLSQADHRDIRIQNVQSGNCDQNNAWGVDSTSIWVNKGCSAVFEYTEVGPPSSASSTNGNLNSEDNGAMLLIAPDFVEPYYGPGFYYGAGYYDEYGWNNNNYCQHNNCNREQQHDNHQGSESFDRDFSGMHGGGGHGGGGRR